MHGELDLQLGSPEWFPFSLDAIEDSVSFIRLTRADYERASFLDARILAGRPAAQAVSWPQTAAAIEAAGLAERCHYIFHIGHVGSTLLARLIGAHPRSFALREPQILRVLTELHAAHTDGMDAGRCNFEARVSGILKLLSRTFVPDQRAVVKATSWVSELAAALLTRPSQPQAVMMYVPPERYLATILGGANSRQEGRILAPLRLKRLQQRAGRELPGRAEDLSEGETLALGWVCEMSALATAARAVGDRILRLDFDRLLAEPEPALSAVLRHLGIEATPADVESIVTSPIMRRYSKAPEYAYDAALRLDVLNQARRLHGPEIKRGLSWLERAATNSPVVREALSFATR